MNKIKLTPMPLFVAASIIFTLAAIAGTIRAHSTAKYENPPFSISESPTFNSDETKFSFVSFAVVTMWTFESFLDDCWKGAEKNGAFCYVRCREGYQGVGPVCWGQCPADYNDDGATCRRDVKIISADNSKCPVYDKCGLILKKGCSVCPIGYKNDGCTCRRDVHIINKPSYGRGAGYLIRSDYHGIFYRYIRDHRNIWMPSANPLKETEKTYLRQFFPTRLVDSVRVVELKEMTGAFSHSASATTYGNDFIIVRKGKRSNELLKHEFVHVCQYDKLGVQVFANTYADQYVDGGYEYSNIEFEIQARSFESKKSKIADYLGYCE